MGSHQSTPEYDKDVNYRNYCDIINSVTSGNFNLDLEEGKYERMLIEEDINDELRPLKNVATDMVVAEFFHTEESLYNFMQLVYNTFDDTLAIYRRKKQIDEQDLFFIYKGGNVLRIVSQEFLLELPNNATRELAKFYTPFFKRSDADFSIYLNPDVKDYDKIFKEISLISYLLQVYIRNVFLGNPNRYFDFTKYNYGYQQKILRKYLAEFNDVEGFSFKNVSIDNANAVGTSNIYRSRADIAIQFVNKKADNTRSDVGAKFDIVKSDSYMVVSYNSALDFRAGSRDDFRVKFNLIRTKISFTLTDKAGKKLNVGGELIDVSIPHRLDNKLQHFYENSEGNIEYFDLTYNDCDLKFRSYSIKYLIDDLESILFKSSDYPWEDNKYVKRLNRLFYMYFVDIFMKIDNGVERLSILKSLKELVLIQYAEYSTDIESGSDAFINRYKKDNLCVTNLPYLMGNLLGKIKTPEQVEELQKMSEVLIKNADFVIVTIENIRQYCRRDGKIRSADIYHTSTKELI